MVAVAAVEEQVVALSDISVDLTVEDLQKWNTSYKKDKGPIAVYTKLCNVQNMGTFL